VNPHRAPLLNRHWMNWFPQAYKNHDVVQQ
jgi:hypothetical protein